MSFLFPISAIPSWRWCTSKTSLRFFCSILKEYLNQDILTMFFPWLLLPILFRPRHLPIAFKFRSYLFLRNLEHDSDAIIFILSVERISIWINFCEMLCHSYFIHILEICEKEGKRFSYYNSQFVVLIDSGEGRRNFGSWGLDDHATDLNFGARNRCCEVLLYFANKKHCEKQHNKEFHSNSHLNTLYTSIQNKSRSLRFEVMLGAALERPKH